MRESVSANRIMLRYGLPSYSDLPFSCRVDISRLFRNALLCINGAGSNVLIILHDARLSLRIRTTR
jgi:hypothetical protein